jgi:hypothetical protein
VLPLLSLLIANPTRCVYFFLILHVPSLSVFLAGPESSTHPVIMSSSAHPTGNPLAGVHVPANINFPRIPQEGFIVS